MTSRKDGRMAEKTKQCVVSGCTEDAEHRGLCEGHWWTHRGLALPEKAGDADG